MPVSARPCVIACLCTAAIIAPVALPAQMMLAPHLLSHVMRQNQQALASHVPAAPPMQHLTYGPDKAQDLAVYLPKPGPTPAPLILFVHGGGWTRGTKDNATGPWKAAHVVERGYAFATIDYRLVPRVRVEEQAADVALALHRLLHDAPRLGIDPRRVVLMGHSAGAHLVALVGTDETYLKGVGLSFADVAGVIPIDGAAYDVPEQMKVQGAYMGLRYEAAFGNDPARQQALSPTFHASASHAPRFLLLHVQRPDGVAQARELAAALRAAGTPVEIDGFPGVGLAGHMAINHRLGDPSYTPTVVVDEWLKGVFGR